MTGVENPCPVTRNGYIYYMPLWAHDFGGYFAPERASNFEPLKEFRAAQNTTCHLRFANVFSFIDCSYVFKMNFLSHILN
jgi:hypothetical protein